MAKKVRMRQKSLPQKAVLAELESRLGKDFNHDSGRIVGSMCTRPHAFARKVYCRYVEKNLGDSGLFPAVAELEREAVGMLGEILGNSHASGHVTTGGTEANILALWAAKKKAKKSPCEVIVPASAHCSFDKAADLLSIKVVKAPLNGKYQVDVEAVRDAISPNTIAIVGAAGTTGLGVVDPIPELSEIAAEKDLYLHVDAAFGGFVLPFLKRLRPDLPSFDFSLPQVRSITVDPHKMGLAPIPAGGIVFRNENLRRTVSWKISYLSGGGSEQATIVGTRSAASVTAVWALLRHLGVEGYTRVVQRCMRLTWRLAREVSAIEDLGVVTEPTMNVVGIKSATLDISEVARQLRLREWAVSLFPHHIRIVVMPHVKEQHVKELIQDLKQIATMLREKEEKANVRTSIQAH